MYDCSPPWYNFDKYRSGQRMRFRQHVDARFYSIDSGFVRMSICSLSLLLQMFLEVRPKIVI